MRPGNWEMKKILRFIWRSWNRTQNLWFIIHARCVSANEDDEIITRRSEVFWKRELDKFYYILISFCKISMPYIGSIKSP